MTPCFTSDRVVLQPHRRWYHRLGWPITNKGWCLAVVVAGGCAAKRDRAELELDKLKKEEGR
jgi:hypothetical protein